MQKKTEGVIFDVQRFSTHDGPGIRTTVFMKGCPLRCFWCHNPESIELRPELLFTAPRCVGCGKCVLACPHGAISAGQINRSLCQGCGICAENCPSRALTLAGRKMAAEEAASDVFKDRLFYERSGGGVTVSGGEALLQSGFVAELLRICKNEDIHTAVDTAGDVPYEAFEEVLPYTDLFLYDLKAADSSLHSKGCGRGNERILENLNRLCAEDTQIVIRIPVVPGFNDSNEEMEGLAALLNGLPRRLPVELLRFHRMGAPKYEALQTPYRAEELSPPDDAKMNELSQILLPSCLGVQIR